MSDVWVIFCSDCDVWGPSLVRSAGRGFRLIGEKPAWHPSDSLNRNMQEAWEKFMADHGYHRLGITHE